MILCTNEGLTARDDVKAHLVDADGPGEWRRDDYSKNAVKHSALCGEAIYYQNYVWSPVPPDVSSDIPKTYWICLDCMLQWLYERP
jgi:hypothetical protein